MLMKDFKCVKLQTVRKDYDSYFVYLPRQYMAQLNFAGLESLFVSVENGKLVLEKGLEPAALKPSDAEPVSLELEE